MNAVVGFVALVAVATAFLSPPQHDASALDCWLCELAVNVTDPPVDNKVKIIESDFLAACKKDFSNIPFIDQSCLNYAHNKFDPIVKELESGTAPEDVCTVIKEC